MTPPPDEPPYTRRDKRVPLDADVSMAFEQTRDQTKDQTKDQTLNVSLGGMFVESDQSQAIGSLAQFEIRLEGEKQPIEGVGEVIWVRNEVDGAGRPAGMGIRFLALDPRSRDKIESLLTVKSAPRVAPAPVTPEEDEPKGEDAPAPAPPAQEQKWSGMDESWPWLDAAGSDPSAATAAQAGSGGVLNESGLYYSAGHPRRPRWRIPLIVGAILIVAGVGIAVVQHLVSADSPETRSPVLTTARTAASPVPPSGAPVAHHNEAAPATAPGPRLPSTSDSISVTASAPKPSSPPPAVARSGAHTGATSGSKQPRQGAASAPSPLPPVMPAKGPSSASTDLSATQSSSPPRAANRVVKIDWKRSPAATFVTIHADGGFAPRAYDVIRLGGPKPRLVLRLRGIEVPYSPATLAIDSPELERIRSGLHRSGGGSELHLVFDLANGTVDLESIKASGEELRLSFGHGGPSHGRS